MQMVSAFFIHLLGAGLTPGAVSVFRPVCMRLPVTHSQLDADCQYSGQS